MRQTSTRGHRASSTNRLRAGSRRATTLVAGVATVGGITLLVKLVATLKELAVAYTFGTTDVVDAFLIAYLLPTLAINVAAGSIGGAFVPVYVQVKERQGEEAAGELLGAVTLLSILVLSVIALLLISVMPSALRHIASAFGPEKLELTRLLAYSLLPVVVLSGIVATWTAALNAEGRFAAAASAPLAVPVATLLTIILASRWIGIYSLALGTVVGIALQGLLLAKALRVRRLFIGLRWRGMTEDLSRVASQYVPLVITAFFVSGTALVDQAMAATLPSGSVAALTYGNKVVAVGLEIGAFALGVVALPYFSRMVARQEWSAVRHTVKRYTYATLAAAIPVTVLLVLASEPLVDVLFRRGAFTADDVTLVGRIQSFYLLQVPFVLAGMLIVRLISALQRNRILLTGAIITFTANIFLNLLLMERLGVAGIALATSIVFVISFSYLVARVYHVLRTVDAGA